MVKGVLLFVVVCLIPSAFSLVQEDQYAPTLLAIYKDFLQRCKMYTGVTEDLIKQVREGNFPEDNSIKRYNDCLWTHHNYLIKPDRSIDERKAKYLLPKGSDPIVQVVVKCNSDNAGEANDTEFFWKMHKCYHANIDSSMYYFL
uniref:Odorant-binding protein n=1 Tax=Galeruca daurica TaxID=1651263 RepID=A0A1U9W511_9CUCU|nr:odorant-binding protein [Galeruca daurica]